MNLTQCHFTLMDSHAHRHRNTHPDDQILFRGQQLLRVQKAVYELCWLFDRGYARHSALRLVGDHYQLEQRQRLAIGRAACSVDNKNSRKRKCLKLTDIKNYPLIVDGFNLIITLEAAMAGAVLLRCRDGCIRDLSGVHGTYRQVAETKSVIEIIGQYLTAFKPYSVHWLFDKPVSNSGRLAHLVLAIANAYGWNWQVDLLNNPDQAISASEKIAITTDSAILDAVQHWVNLTNYLLEQHFQQAWLIDFS